jgi:hypothetical protein
MNNKNSRIALQIQRIEESLKDLATSFQVIREVLLEKESVPSGPVKMVKGGMEWSTKLNKWVPAMIPAGSVGSSLHSDSWKEEMTAEINANNAKLVAQSVGRSEPHTVVHCVPSTAVDNSILGKQNNINCKGEQFTNTQHYRLIHSNTQVNYYKCITGRDAGTVLKVSKNGKVLEDGRWNGRTKGRLAMLTADSDGHAYAKQMVKQIRTLVPKRTIKLHRNYRPVYPNGYSGPKRKFCAVYTESEWGNY